MQKKEFRAMGCQITAWVDSDSIDAVRALGQVPDWFETWEQSLSRFRDDSELCRVNRLPDELQSVSETFWQVMQTAREMEEISEGLVTPVILDALETAGYTQDFAMEMVASSPSLVPGNLQKPNLFDIEFFPDNRLIRLPAGLRMDFGGVAKGWAAHQTMLRLSEYGPAMVNAGGDISISGPKSDGNPWQVGIIDPLQPEMDLVRLSLRSGGLATSGKDYRKWVQNGVLRHHIIDPRTGEPAMTDVLTASVAAPNVMEAEMAAKMIFILGTEDGGEWLQEHSQYASLLVMDAGELFASEKMKKLMWRNNGSTNQSDSS
jgi:thiamine biosynthesis lipoprotein